MVKTPLRQSEARDRLLDPDRRVAPQDIASLTDLSSSGLYAWFVDQTGATEISKSLGSAVGPGLIYAGQAGAGGSSATLGSRIRRNHIRGNIYGSTFRLTIAAAMLAPLALEPTGGRRMTSDSEVRLSEWMHKHLKVAVVAYQDRRGLDTFETAILDLMDPPLNLAKRPPTKIRQRLTMLRRAFTGRPMAKTKAVITASRPARETSAGNGPTPEELARALGLPNAKSVRGFLRDRFPRSPNEKWSRWGPLSREMESAVRGRFAGRG